MTNLSLEWNEWYWDKCLLLGKKGWKFNQINLVQRQILIKVGRICPNTTSFLQNCAVSFTFYPNLPIILHRYICHICDISQLWRSDFNISCHRGDVIFFDNFSHWKVNVQIFNKIDIDLKDIKSSTIDHCIRE